MKKIITNDYNLNEEDITEHVVRVKLLIVNSNNELLLGYSHNEYQCIGGHVLDGESLISAINREVQEETGINLSIKKAKPFASSIGYYKDWPAIGKNRKTVIYYYEIRTDEKPNLNNTSYTESEKKGSFELRYIPIENVENEFIKNAEIYGDKHGIVKEMLKVFKIYKDLKYK